MTIFKCPADIFIWLTWYYSKMSHNCSMSMMCNTVCPTSHAMGRCLKVITQPKINAGNNLKTQLELCNMTYHVQGVSASEDMWI
jgi:hypothetical protein